MAYKVIITFPDGDTLDSYEEDGDEGIFDTEDEAQNYADEWMNGYQTGGEVLHMSNPGDYPLEVVGQEPDFEIVEV